MSSITTWLWGTSQLDDAVDKATSELLPTDAEDIALNLEICDQIRSKSVSSKDAMRALKRRLNHKNPNVQLLALGLTDICIKNGGDQLLVEVASREFMDNIVSILKIPVLNIDVKNKILRLIQSWAVSFEGKPSLNYVGQVYRNLKNEGFVFPPQDMAVANSAMVDTQTAPEWIDSDVCLRCRTPFSFTNRKHHCRNCGQVFDQQCSSKTMPLPHFGITQDVRVCDGCYSKLGRRGERSGHRHSASVHSSRHRSARELADAELQRAIQLSLEEAGFANPQSRRPGYVPHQPSISAWQTSEPPLVDHSTYPSGVSDRKSPIQYEEDDPDLKAAIEASLREASAPKPSAPVAMEPPRSEEAPFDCSTGPGYSQSYPPATIPTPSVPKLPNYDLEPLESDAILTFSQTVEQVQAQGGRDIARYPAANELFDKANGLRPKLVMSLDDTGRKEHMLSEMHDKLSQAVKLYDRLLTEQVSHPPWRPPQSAPHTPQHQQVNSTYNQPLNGVNGSYNQWAPEQLQVQGASSVYQRSTEPLDPRHAQSSHASYSSAPPVEEYANSYPSSPQTESSHQAQRYASLTAEVPLGQTWHTQETPFSGGSYQTQHDQQPIQKMAQMPSRSQPPALVPQHILSRQPPERPSTYTTSPSLAFAAIPTSLSPVPTSQQEAYAPPPTLPVNTQLPPTGSSLSRHSTVAYTASAPSLSATPSHLSRSHTVAHPPLSQQYVQSPPPTSLPTFPVAPTSAPQAFSAYGSSLPPSSPPERKEALLIDL